LTAARRPYLYCFDVLWLNGLDLRGLPPVERKAILKTLGARAGRRSDRPRA